MMMKLEQSGSDRLGFLVSGKLTDNDYKNFLIPQVRQALLHHDKIRLLFLLEDFRGWELQAAWDDLIFGLEINHRVERVAVLGSQEWERWMAQLVNPFSNGEIQFYQLNQTEQAWQWINQQPAVAGSAG